MNTYRGLFIPQLNLQSIQPLLSLRDHKDQI